MMAFVRTISEFSCTDWVKPRKQLILLINFKSGTSSTFSHRYVFTVTYKSHLPGVVQCTQQLMLQPTHVCRPPCASLPSVMNSQLVSPHNLQKYTGRQVQECHRNSRVYKASFASTDFLPFRSIREIFTLNSCKKIQ
jgi:hypothetical protein